MSVYLRDFPLLKDMSGGSLKICCREGLFSIKCHFSHKTCFRFDTAMRYCVTKGKISFGLSFFCFSTDSLSVNLMSNRIASIRRLW